MRILSAFAASAVMLTLAQPPTGVWLLAWVALVPFILICSPRTKPLYLFLCAYIVGLFYWLGNIYWMGYVTVAGWIAFCAYTALLWPMLVLSIRFCRLKKIPLTIAVPVLVVGAEQLQGLFLGGFYWHYLAHSQYANITLIQIADIFGAAGVSFLVAMVNGLIAELIIAANEKRLLKTANFIMTFLVCAAIIGTVAYGKWRINQSDKHITTGPMVAAVQTSIPQSVKQSFAAEEQIFDDLLDQSGQSATTGAKLIVWPETMVQAILEPQVLRLLDSSHSYNMFNKAISEHAKTGTYVLVGAYGGSPRIENNFDIRLAQKFNAAFLYKPDGKQADEQYGKIHLVPFGEYIPFKQTVPFLHKLLLAFTPYDYDYTLDAGREYTVFSITDMNDPNGGTYRFSAMICYEDAVPKMARRFALNDRGHKQIDWLVNISNDGWFVRFKDDKIIPSTELAQHTAVCVFRAVENRLAILRSVNTGISCLIDSLGRIKDGYAAGNLPAKAMARQGMAGWFADRVPIDKRTTFFSRYGQWLDFCCEGCFIMVIIAQLLGRKENKYGQDAKQSNKDCR
jgi:apolipoprotein N-acyltransferase